MIRETVSALRARFFLPAAGALVMFSWAPRASALLEECGNIELDGDVECEVQVEGGCQAACEPPKLEVACAGELRVGCEGECDAEFDVGCSGSCQGDCEAECDVDPGSFSCEGRCGAECKGGCQGRCEASGNKGECAASCEVTCDSECQVECDVTPPSGSCEARCEGSCEGECRADARIDCQVDCQAEGFGECKVDLQGRCEVQCERPEGAIFCDGQFVDASDVKSCIGAIEAALNIKVQVEADADGSCKKGSCEGEASAKASCALSAPGRASSPAGWVMALSLLAGVAFFRRR